MKAIASKAKHGSLCLESQHSGGWGKKTVNWKPAWTISQDTVERKGRRGGRKRGKNSNLKTGLQEMNKVASGRLFLSSWSRISGFQTPLSPQRSSLTCPVCQREPKRKNLLLPKSVSILLISFYTLYLWILGSLAPQPQFWDQPFLWGRRPPQCSAKYKSPFVAWTLSSLFVPW